MLFSRGYASQPPTVTTPGTTSGVNGGTWTNTTGFAINVYLTAVSGVGTISVNGSTLVGTIAPGAMATVAVPSGQTISFAYNGNLTWKWLAV